MTPEEFDHALLWRYRAKPLRVIDGDTVVVLADTGFYGRHEVHVRIADLYAPELSAPGGVDAKSRLEGALMWTSAPWPLRVATRQKERVVSEQQSFERFVADVFVRGMNGDLVNVKEVL